jgi:hypothetical protein
MNFIDETFGHAFVILDFAEKQLNNLSLLKKKEVLNILVKNASEKLKMYDQEIRYRQNLAKEFTATRDHK